MPLNYSVGDDSWKSHGQQGDQTSQSEGKSTLNAHWKDWCWSWTFSILVIWCRQLTHWKSPWCWERLRAKGEESMWGWDGWIASPTLWIWTWANFERWYGTERWCAGSMGSQRFRQDWVTEQQCVCVCVYTHMSIYMNLMVILNQKFAIDTEK